MINIESRRLEGPIFEWAFWILVVLCALSAIFWWTTGILFLAGMSFFGWIVLLYGGFVEPQFLQVKTYRLSLVKEPKVRLRVAFLSDFHAGKYKQSAYFARVVAKTMAEKPDLILLGGDLVDEVAATVKDLTPLKKLRAPLGNYFILGNHDFLDDPNALRKQLSSWGFEDLTNTARRLEKNGRGLEVIALEDSYFGQPKVGLLRAASELPRVVLLHEPDNLFDVEAGQADVVFLGHTHGGQVRLPFIGSVSRLPQEAPQWLDRGLKYWKGAPVVISQGIGESTSRARLFCLPQVVIVELGI